MPFSVSDNADESRYDLYDGDRLIGVAAYRLSGDSITFTHTQVDPEYEGQGAGSQLAREALDDSRARDRRVVVHCPFITAWIRRHPDYADLLR
ncbi:MAG TPA: GNAT family N-acetyltransferase [Propionibacteriaceae bacterium]|nr:GNAT family N-acetyltransferase [Propionibacteriaceae bacterium]